MDLLTLAELMTLVRMLAELVGSIDKINDVVEQHIARRLLKPAVDGWQQKDLPCD